MTLPWFETDIRVDHHPACQSESAWPQALTVMHDPVRFPGAEVLVCEGCGARVIVRQGQVIKDPDREALELSWRRDALEAEHERLAAEARQRARVESLREQVRDLEANQETPPYGRAQPNRGGRPRRDRDMCAKLWFDAAVAIRERGVTPTYKLMGKQIDDKAESTMRDWRRDLGLPVPSKAGLEATASREPKRS